jgi:RND family efflux transporter MFP subunit
MSKLFETSEENLPPPPSRRAIYILPIAILIGIMLLLWFTAGASFGGSAEVEVVRARLGDSKVISQNNTSFQAAGWLQADPYPVAVTSLASGVVNHLYVVEGDQVKAGQVLAELDDSDARLDWREAKANVEIAQQEFDVSKREENVLEQKVAQIKQEVKRQSLELEGVEKSYQRLKRSGAAISELVLEEAEYERLVKQAEVEKVKIGLKVLQSEWEKAQQLVKVRESEINRLKIREERAKLNLDRMKIISPVSGIVEKLYARIGRKQMLASDQPVSTTVATVFDPKNIFARVDVPLADAFKVKLGQQAQVQVEGLKQKLPGLVTNLSGEADEQKNTLSVRVRLKEQHPRLRPEMLVQVSFMAVDSRPSLESSNQSIYLHPDAILNGQVALVNAASKIQWRQIEVGPARHENWVEVLRGLKLGERVVLKPNVALKEGQKVRFGGGHE